MIEELAIGIGLFINTIFIEIIGITAGGMVVPGYVALRLDEPSYVLTTILISLTTFILIQHLSRFVIIYGRRLLMYSILLGFVLTRLFNFVLDSGLIIDTSFQLKAIGLIIPGLLAYWMARQGVVESICGLITGSVLTRMILMIIMGGKIL